MNQHTLNRKNGKRPKGFTLIELLVVVIIIGILAAIAVPIFLNQRKAAWKAAAESDTTNGALAVESARTHTGTLKGVSITPGTSPTPMTITTDGETTHAPTSPGDTMTAWVGTTPAGAECYAVMTTSSNLPGWAAVRTSEGHMTTGTPPANGSADCPRPAAPAPAPDGDGDGSGSDPAPAPAPAPAEPGDADGDGDGDSPAPAPAPTPASGILMVAWKPAAGGSWSGACAPINVKTAEPGPVPSPCYTGYPASDPTVPWPTVGESVILASSVSGGLPAVASISGVAPNGGTISWTGRLDVVLEDGTRVSIDVSATHATVTPA